MKVLVANRGEIAVRVLRACRDVGMSSVAVYSEGDRHALHTRCADEALLIGPTPAAQSYLNIQAVLEAAKRSGADAVHPGYGFLSENADFATAVESSGLTFIGPRAETLNRAGDKLAARRIARELGIPVLDDRDAMVPHEMLPDYGTELRYPLLVKAVAGGGGRGIRLVASPDALEAAVAAARREAQAAFGDDGVYLEPYLSPARHIEVQILGDGHGRVLSLGERECSIQRRRQKLIEEAPAPQLGPAVRTGVLEAAVQLGTALRYRSLGTVEFLVAPDGAFYFIEINPRIQVEHGVTEMVTGMDLVAAQLELAAGSGLRYRQADVALRGAAIEARVIAEDPATGFVPTTGEITYLKEPGGPGVRVDSALYQGMTVTTDYDSLLAKVMAWGATRKVAAGRLRRALDECRIGGVVTDLAFLQEILEDARFVVGDLDITFLDQVTPQGKARAPHGLGRELAAAVALLAHRQRRAQVSMPAGQDGREALTSRTETRGSGWRMTGWREQM